jgi:hypothetical protein
MHATPQEIVKAFNEWLRRYEDEPHRFEAEFRMIERFKAEQAEGVEPTYGETCAAYLDELVREQRDEADAAVRRSWVPPT